MGRILKIEIETDGSAEGTRVKMNGVVQDKLVAWEISVRKHPGKSMSPITISGKRSIGFVNGKSQQEPFSFYGPAAIEKLTDPTDGYGPEDVIGCALHLERSKA